MAFLEPILSLGLFNRIRTSKSEQLIQNKQKQRNRISENLNCLRCINTAYILLFAFTALNYVKVMTHKLRTDVKFNPLRYHQYNYAL